MGITKETSVYFMGIAGTGMAPSAGLLKTAGYNICGSDKDIYPPMSTMLESLKIPLFTPYAPENLKKSKAELVVVANSLSRGHIELEEAIRLEIPQTSFPQILGDVFLKQATSVVICGTHGKTTTSSLVAHMLMELGEDPSFLIGGIPKNFSQSFRLGRQDLFVLEGDEYDTVYFDKESKFLHYHPEYVVLNNIEFDHADIFKDLESIRKMFAKLLKLVKDPSKIIANTDDAVVVSLLKELELFDKVFRVSDQGKDPTAEIVIKNLIPPITERQPWKGVFATALWGEIELTSLLAGEHNWANIGQVLGFLTSYYRHHLAGKQPLWSKEAVIAACHSFLGVKRRLDHLTTSRGVKVYEDFAHHPTAVQFVLKSFRQEHPTSRIVVCFEPKNATSRRNVFEKDYSEVLNLADIVLLGACHNDERIPLDQRMNTSRLRAMIGKNAHEFTENTLLLDWLKENSQSNDAVIFLSSGSFSGIQHQFAASLNV